MKSAFWFFKANSVTKHMDANNPTKVTKIINGGTNHLSERVKYTQKAISVLKKKVNHLVYFFY